MIIKEKIKDCNSDSSEFQRDGFLRPLVSPL